MRNDSYRIIDLTLAMFEEDGRHLARFVLTGAIITIEDGDYQTVLKRAIRKGLKKAG